MIIQVYPNEYQNIWNISQRTRRLGLSVGQKFLQSTNRDLMR